MFQKPIFGRKVMAAAQQVADIVSPTDTADLGGLVSELRRLDLLKPGLGQKAVHYVATGDPAVFPQLLKTIVDKVGRSSYNSDYFKDSIALNESQGKADVALAKGEIADHQVIARFIALRRVMRPSVQQKCWNRPDLPDAEMLPREYLSALSGGDGRLNTHGYNVDPKPAVVPTLTPREVLEKVEQLGGDVVLYFKTQSVHTYSLFSRRDHFKREFTQLVSENARAFAEAMREQHDENGTKTFLTVAQQLDVLSNPTIMAAVFGLLGKGNAKAVREHAVSTLAKLDLSILPGALKLGLAEGELEMRYDLVQIAGQVAEPQVLDILREHVPNERSGKVKGAIEAIIESEEAAPIEAVDLAEESTIKLANGETFKLEPIDQSLLAPPSVEDFAEFSRLVDLVNKQREIAKTRTENWIKSWSDHLHPITPDERALLFKELQGECYDPSNSKHLRFEFDFKDFTITEEMRDWLDNAPFALRWRTAIWLTPVEEFARILESRTYDKNIANELIKDAIQEEVDLLAIAALCERKRSEHGNSRGHLAAIRTWMTPHQSWYSPWKNPLKDLPLSIARRIVAASLEVFDEQFGIGPSKGALSVKQACAMLAVLPAAPEHHVPKLVELGLTGKRGEREAVQELLETAKGIDKRLEEALDDRRQDVRAHAATWLADMRANGSETVLRKRLKKEKAEKVRAALIEALLRLGADLSDVIGPEALVKEAEKKGGKLTLPDWLTPETIPSLRFVDGSDAPRSLAEYWIGLAVKLKDPGNTGLFGIYLDQLLQEDAKSFSAMILQSWIGHDTFGPSDEEANAYASQYVDGRFASWSRYNKELTRDAVFASLKREKLRELPNTGTKTKGILALACRAEPAFAADRVRWFLKKHGRRSHQAMALLDMLAGMNSPTAMQVVIAAATRLKQKSTMAHANAIAERYAKDRGWSYEELADRTVPTAGFDDEGVMELPCGMDEKLYTARIDADLTVHISNPVGKAIKALPAGDDDATKESKKSLSAAKRELKQVITMQTERLAEAMAVERQWPVEDWLESFHGHPVMRRLIERLVWQSVDADGNPQGLVRPTQEGDFTNEQDEEVDVSGFVHLRLAHAAVIDEQAATAWRAHLKDYEIKPLIDQFPKDYQPFGGEEPSATAITEKHGWLGESRSYRGAAEKLNYQREIGDGGGCTGYYKTFASAGISAVIETYGGLAVDENLPQALKDLFFRRPGSYQGMPLEEVPPVLLAMCHADLKAIAKKGSFDPEWEDKVQW